jgi:hypothetical protein
VEHPVKMLTAVGRASLRRLVAPSLLPRVTPLLARKVPSAPVTRLLETVAATLQTRAISTTRCLALPAGPKKKAAARTKAKKAAPKKKKKQKKPAKKKVAARKKKTVSPEKKAAAEKRALKEQALLKGSPNKLPDTPWLLFVQPKLKGSKGREETTQNMKDTAAEFKSISEARLRVSSLLKNSPSAFPVEPTP